MTFARSYTLVIVRPIQALLLLAIATGPLWLCTYLMGAVVASWLFGWLLKEVARD